MSERFDVANLLGNLLKRAARRMMRLCDVRSGVVFYIPCCLNMVANVLFDEPGTLGVVRIANVELRFAKC
jgi:hypothetical protein